MLWRLGARAGGYGEYAAGAGEADPHAMGPAVVLLALIGGLTKGIVYSPGLAATCGTKLGLLG